MPGTIPEVRPSVGDGGTVSIGSDRYAVTVVDVSASGGWVKVQRDSARLVSGNIQSESQSYEYSPDPTAPVERFTWARTRGRYVRSDTYRLTVGERREYQDPSF